MGTKTTYKCVHSIVGVLKHRETELYEDIGNEQVNIHLQPVHVHHKVLKKIQMFGFFPAQQIYSAWEKKGCTNVGLYTSFDVKIDSRPNKLQPISSD